MGTEKTIKNSQYVQLFDTTLRDGAQGEYIHYSLQDKLDIAEALDDFGIDYIEGGWPGSNPKDMAFFKQCAKKKFKNAKITAFGSTRRKNMTPESDATIQALIKAETPVVSLFGKAWKLHIKNALHVETQEHLAMVYESVEYLCSHGKDVVFDAEHFFDGYRHDPGFAVATLKAAIQGGAGVIVLCDTNGGTLPWDVYDITKEIVSVLPVPIGVHAHNDSGCGVASTLAAVHAGAVHVQGTINGFGERCGNADLISIIPALELKMQKQTGAGNRLSNLTYLSRYVSEISNTVPRNESPYAGYSAFAHKGGVHVSAVMRDPHTYEHVDPDIVGNRRRVLVSDLAGRSNVRYKISELGLKGIDDTDIADIVARIKRLENLGYSFEGANASFELLVRNNADEPVKYFNLSGFRQFTEKNSRGKVWNEASIRVCVDDIMEHTAATGNGPVNALDNALKKALARFYPEVEDINLIDYKVRVLNDGENRGTASKVRVLIENQSHEQTWTTVGVSENIIEASWIALVDSYNYFLFKITGNTMEEATYETQHSNI